MMAYDDKKAPPRHLTSDRGHGPIHFGGASNMTSIPDTAGLTVSLHVHGATVGTIKRFLAIAEARGYSDDEKLPELEDPMTDDFIGFELIG